MTCPMRIPAILICASLVVSHARADSLTAADREALLENLEKIRENAESKVDARFRMAISAYREAMSTDESAMDFYLKCIEKVNFEDQQRKNSDFRDWKRKEGDKLGDQAFRLALRVQLRWLILTLRASSEKAKLSELAVEAQEVVDSIFRDADKLAGQAQTLGQPVTSTVFARAYDIGGLDKETWPLSPVQLDAIYNQVIFPQLRTPARVESLRAAWIKRIQQEITKFDVINRNGGGNGGNGGIKKAAGNGGGTEIGPGSPEHEKFMTENVPQYQWDMEMDLFRSGDEAGAAVRMIAHIQKHLEHKSSRDWTQQLKALLTPKPAPAPATAETQPNN